MKKGQAAIETAMVIGILLLLTMAFVAVVSGRLISAADKRDRDVADDLADVIESELSMAAIAQDGYSRTFTLPASLDGKEYKTEFYNKSETRSNFSQFVISVDIGGKDYGAVGVVPDNIVGSISAGDNLVRKRDGMVNVTTPLGG